MPINQEDLLYHFIREDRYVLVPRAEIQPTINQLAGALRTLNIWGINLKGVAAADFDFQGAIMEGDRRRGADGKIVGVHPRLQLLVKHEGTGRSQLYDVEYIGIGGGGLITAIDMLRLAEPGDGDDQ